MKNLRRFVNTFLLGITLVLLYALSSGDSAAPGHFTPASTRKRFANITVADLSGNAWKPYPLVPPLPPVSRIPSEGDSGNPLRLTTLRQEGKRQGDESRR